MTARSGDKENSTGSAQKLGFTKRKQKKSLYNRGKRTFRY